jgi:F-type H+-transporting ATPase subunit b
MRTVLRSLFLLTAAAAPAIAQEGAQAVEVRGLLDPSIGLMFWTLIIFVILVVVLKFMAFGPLTAAVEAREKALEDAILAAKADREEAAKLLAEHRAALEASRGEAQKLIADARVSAERVRAELIEQAHTEHASMMAKARQDIAAEQAKAIAALRREAVDLAIAGAGKVIEKNLDSAGNRALVEKFLSSVTPEAAAASR